jgi:hypothetical protein
MTFHPSDGAERKLYTGTCSECSEGEALGFEVHCFLKELGCVRFGAVVRGVSIWCKKWTSMVGEAFTFTKDLAAHQKEHRDNL